MWQTKAGTYDREMQALSKSLKTTVGFGHLLPRKRLLTYRRNLILSFLLLLMETAQSFKTCSSRLVPMEALKPGTSSTTKL